LWFEIRRQTPEKLALARKILEEVRDGHKVQDALRRNPLPDGGYIGKHMLVAAYRQLTESGEWEYDAEFLARIRSALRRSSFMDLGDSAKNRVIVVGDLMIDTEYRLVIVRGEEIHFTPTEYNLLVYLAQRAGKMITHRELLREIWGGEYGDEREYLRVYISQIRHKIELDPLRPKYIITESGVGYRLRE